MLRYQVLLQDYGQSGLWKNRKINIKKKEKGKNMKYTADTKPGMGDPYWYEWSVGQKSIQVVLPWSTWAIIAILRTSSRFVFITNLPFLYLLLSATTLVYHIF